MAEPTYRVLEILAQLLVLATGTRITYVGEENVPDQGGAVVAINHTSYVDWLPAALAMHRRRRRMRFMIKAEMQRVRLVNFLIRHTRTIPVDRGAGGSAYAVAVQRLREGELVGVYPEATISRSFELKARRGPPEWPRKRMSRLCPSLSGVLSGSGPRTIPGR